MKGCLKMKIRNGFVSNSSSSSFVVNKKTNADFTDIPKEMMKKKPGYYTIVLPQKNHGCSDFGWEVTRWMDTASKLNYATIQAMYSKNKWDYLYTLEKAIGKRFKETHGENEDIYVYWNYNAVFYGSEDQFATIDHQSTLADYECSNWAQRNGEMSVVHDIFESVENMENFLFNPDAYIQGGNDNGGNESEEYRESEAYIYGKIYNIHRDRDAAAYFLGDGKKLDPLYEGTCKVCGTPMEYRTFNQDYYETPESERKSEDFWDSLRDRVGVPHGDNDPWYDGYYICSNPDCECHKKVFPVTDYSAQDAPVLDRYKEFK